VLRFRHSASASCLRPRRRTKTAAFRSQIQSTVTVICCHTKAVRLARSERCVPQRQAGIDEMAHVERQTEVSVCPAPRCRDAIGFDCTRVTAVGRYLRAFAPQRNENKAGRSSRLRHDWALICPTIAENGSYDRVMIKTAILSARPRRPAMMGLRSGHDAIRIDRRASGGGHER